MKNKNGITLIALVITIIVLLILAGVSISLTLGNNGVLNQATNAVSQNKKATAKEEVQMAWASATSNYWSDWTNNSGVDKENYFTAQNLTKYVEETGEILISEPMEDGTYHVKYESKDQGKKYDFKIDENGNISELYLSDIVEIGDYVDIGINYENQVGPNNRSKSTELLGWRVLDIENNNNYKSIKLISAGMPIIYFYGRGIQDMTIANTVMSDLFVEIFPDLNNNKHASMGFYKNGFDSNDLRSSSVFGNKPFIDYTRKIHAVTSQEIVTLYYKITGIEKTKEQLKNMQSKLLSDLNLGLTSGDKAIGLIDNGTNYWCNPEDTSVEHLEGVFHENSHMGSSYDEGFGFRPVLYLVADAKLADDNTGDGSSSASAYKITK